MNRLGRIARSLGHFWWDFLIGDTPELLATVLIVVVAALVLRHHHTAAVVVLPTVAIVGLLASTWRGRRTP
jgi:hypothetical protein